MAGRGFSAKLIWNERCIWQGSDVFIKFQNSAHINSWQQCCAEWQIAAIPAQSTYIVAKQMWNQSIVQMGAANQYLHAKHSSIIFNGKSRYSVDIQWRFDARKRWLHVSVAYSPLNFPLLTVAFCRMYVIGSLPNLEYLDDVKISDEQRAMARAHINTYSINGVPINFVEHFSNTAHMLTNSKYDGRTHRRYTKFGNGINKLVPKRNGTKIDRLWVQFTFRFFLHWYYVCKGFNKLPLFISGATHFSLDAYFSTCLLHIVPYQCVQ